ncbi:DUF2975 domain-containing protein [Cellulosimicrobium cellulans]|uniref:DUF2975 domain-containing protein n=1 Tax=Cellulosimicrobium cellulans TaxID=1710 RepID=UPI00084895C8|nr:DUF2975 domain-containing protein [Cellulosimicrobium cellulans]
MNTTLTVTLRTTLALLLLGALACQIAFIPLVAQGFADAYPEVSHLAVPYTSAAILALACFDIALIAIWQLLTLVRRQRIFDAKALKWVDAITTCAAAASVLAIAVFVHMIFVEQTGGPAGLLALVGSLVGGAALVLLMVVMRGLLETAISDRSELAEVI